MKLTFIQYLFNIKSMRQTIKEVEVNIAYRWFLGFDFYDEIHILQHLARIIVEDLKIQIYLKIYLLR